MKFTEEKLERAFVVLLGMKITGKEFFEGVSIPRNKELVRIFKDLDMVEQLGSGVSRILEHYGKEYFRFMPYFLRMTLMSQIDDVAAGDTIDDSIGGAGW